MAHLENNITDQAELQKTQICGFPVLCASYPQVLAEILHQIELKNGGWVVTLNLEMVSLAKMDLDYRRLLQSADTVIADGMPIVWATYFKPKALKIPERSTGSDLTQDLLQRVPANQIAILGGEEPQRALDKLQIPKREDVSIFDGIVKADAEWLGELVETWNSRDIRLIFLALGVPKQDHVAQILRELLPGVVLIGVGGSFELIAGHKRRAPVWMQLSGMEWLFRLAIEPRRLWYRYCVRYWMGLGFLTDDCLRGK